MRKRTKASKYNYQLFKLVDEGTLYGLCERNAMSKGNLEYGFTNNKVIYGEYYVIKKPIGECYGK